MFIISAPIVPSESSTPPICNFLSSFNSRFITNFVVSLFIGNCESITERRRVPSVKESWYMNHFLLFPVYALIRFSATEIASL